MQCSCGDSKALSKIERLQYLTALETTLDEELDELERQYSLNLRKLDWLHTIGHPDLCDVITKNMDKTESLLRMYRPMLENAWAEKMELIQSIMESHGVGNADPGDDYDLEFGMDDLADRLPDTISELNGDDEFRMRCT